MLTVVYLLRHRKQATFIVGIIQRAVMNAGEYFRTHTTITLPKYYFILLI